MQAMTRNAEPLLDQVYGAIADPTRRAILAVLAGGEETVGTLADRFPISFNGVSKHVKVLERAGLVQRAIRGREHRLKLNPTPLRQAARWLEHYRAFWEMRLDGLEAFLAKQPRPTTSGRARQTGQTGKGGK
jgi:DNA-binding transcriptional ArsR family regulator